ncbi:MAG: hypothetical protein A2W52_00535 [Candidatus Taylorbacteria bacterium RIFCSPHIGHO2_02_49_25]|uniref:Uncharacterized protein n=1 Tax=Candidatus Taylorbacteria bacterium RIFCSPHIGHO2_02_49_25 TaxID=1802305 RepID=A0A1G2MHF2_9BACT|nr:MAG: hypothetical protein A2759_02725 [Candidatus Taylorbacteria bacterium RIFCSPHIGHO2_01_FULL_49_60]OHA22461.1 MAG: hypothetical protein A2W52_00535 [Candidatus Taylorbacteria bacterium RIFCSPHIGHO2_02_49_25]OHA37490.1 MAG: hypothetical protein A2W65_01500 [Candidatus Taylorbacteria bacterium RIFCSPLOWO2_02_50_13]OHA41351.1 MAG: hypothetical protein A3H73_02675 [Candidatus Taylorbacteria bacterium RIFCSPLOWO2_02_FULL_50_120]
METACVRARTIRFFGGADDFIVSVKIVEGGGKRYKICGDIMRLKLFCRPLHHFGKAIQQSLHTLNLRTSALLGSSSEETARFGRKRRV